MRLFRGSGRHSTGAVLGGSLIESHPEPRRMRVDRLLVAAALLVTPACGDGGPERARAFTVQDSAGVRVAESWDPAWTDGDAWRLSDDPLLTIGAVAGDPAHELWRVMGSRRLSDGRIVVANAGSSELRFFDPDGNALTASGGEGDGPGEFTSIAQLEATPSDTIVVFDGALQRVSILNPEGAYVRSFALPQIEERAFPRPRGGVFADGSLLAYTEHGADSFPFDEGGVLIREPGLYYRLDAQGESVEVIGELPMRGYYVHPRVGSVLIPFEAHPWPVAAGESFYFGDAHRFEIGEYDRDGSLRRAIRWHREPAPVTPGDVDAFMRIQLDRIEMEENRLRMEEILREIYPDIPTPSTQPAFSDLKVDDAGNLWVAEYRPPAVPRDTWFVFDVEGRLLGPVTMPESLQVDQIGIDFVLGRSEDELGVERVELYELRRPDR